MAPIMVSRGLRTFIAASTLAVTAGFIGLAATAQAPPPPPGKPVDITVPHKVETDEFTMVAPAGFILKGGKIRSSHDPASPYSSVTYDTSMEKPCKYRLVIEKIEHPDGVNMDRTDHKLQNSRGVGSSFEILHSKNFKHMHFPAEEVTGRAKGEKTLIKIRGFATPTVYIGVVCTAPEACFKEAKLDEMLASIKPKLPARTFPYHGRADDGPFFRVVVPEKWKTTAVVEREKKNPKFPSTSRVTETSIEEGKTNKLTLRKYSFSETKGNEEALLASVLNDALAEVAGKEEKKGSGFSFKYKGKHPALESYKKGTDGSWSRFFFVAEGNTIYGAILQSAKSGEKFFFDKSSDLFDSIDWHVSKR